MDYPLFVFGTLRDPDVLTLVLGRSDRFRSEVASLCDYAARTVRERDYPMLVSAPGAHADGLLIHDLDDTDRARLIWFEGDTYVLEARRVDTATGSVPAQLFAAPETLPSSGPWQFESWQMHDKPGFLERARHCMAAFGSAHQTTGSVVWGHDKEPSA